MTAQILPTPLGDMLAAAEDGALCGLWFVGQRYYPAKADAWLGNEWKVGNNSPLSTLHSPLFVAAHAWLDACFAGRDPGAPPRLAPRGTPFQQKIWAALREIPRGQTTTYGALALLCGTSPRAVGGAVGRNPISVMIPCHRVLGSAHLTGYAGGLERKRALLELEGAL